MIEYFLVVLFICLVYIWYQWFQKGPKFPPGPSPFCLDGHLALFKKNKHQVLKEMGKKYGPIFHVYFASKYVIVLNSYEVMKEALERKGDCFLERPHVYMFDWFHNNEGLSLSHGENWRQQRNFVDHTFNECGFGKSSIKSSESVTAEQIIMTEIDHAIVMITAHKGKAFSLHHFMERFVANIIFTFIYDKRYDYDDTEADKLFDFVEEVSKNFNPLNPINCFPLLRFFSKSFKSFEKITNFTRNYFSSIVEDHDHTYHPEYHRNFVDVYLDRIKTDRINKIPDSKFTKGNLVKIIECLHCGECAITASLLWFIKYMIIYPDKQKKLRDELHQHFPTNSLIYLSDRPKMPYTEAAILENHRLSSVVPLAFFRLSTEDVKILNYEIPKDTMILPNIYAVHNDERYWPDPREFRPERFLDLEGHLQMDIESLIPFSLGHRDCPAKPLTKHLLTLFVANLFHRFEFVTPENESPPDINNFDDGLMLRPFAFNVCAKLCNQMSY